MLDTSYTEVPDELRRLIHSALWKELKNERLTNELKEAFAEAPTLDELASRSEKGRQTY